jgi:hypothetical protein
MDIQNFLTGTSPLQYPGSCLQRSHPCPVGGPPFVPVLGKVPPAIPQITITITIMIIANIVYTLTIIVYSVKFSASFSGIFSTFNALTEQPPGVVIVCSAML